jgi:hypothetical protein
MEREKRVREGKFEGGGWELKITYLHCGWVIIGSFLLHFLVGGQSVILEGEWLNHEEK